MNPAAGDSGPARGFAVVTIFPEMFASFLEASLVGKAIEDRRLAVDLVDPRGFTTDRHRSTDDTPYGGGSGMVMRPGPVVDAMESVDPDHRRLRILLTPQGERLEQRHLQQLADDARDVLLVCGRYEGFDERVRSHVDRELSLGDFVLNGGEVAAMALIDGVARLVPGVIGNAGSLQTESHAAGLLEHPHYTRPRAFRGEHVPEVLLGGDHARIARWRRQQMLLRTRARRPDLWRRVPLDAGDRALLREAGVAGLHGRTHVALLHHPVLDRTGKVVTTAITNLDIHDIARSSRTYGLGGYYIVTPLDAQRELARRIIAHWRTGHGAAYNERRAEALAPVEIHAELDEVVETVARREGRRPVIASTSAVARPGQLSSAELTARVGDAPLLLLLGTGWGLTDEALARADLALAPIRGRPRYNHLSVRSAAAILLDRLFGLRD